MRPFKLFSNNISDQTMMSGVGYLAIIAVTILGIQFFETGPLRVIALILLASFAILFARMPEKSNPAWQLHLQIGVMAAIVAALMYLSPHWSIFPMLFFVLSPTTMMTFPNAIGLRWIIIFTLITGIIFRLSADWATTFMTLLPFAAGYWFFGAFARAMKTAEEARNQSQRLLGELQETHTQLQAYAAQIEELAIAEERNRLAREMHDTLGHRLTVAAVQLEGAQRLIPQNPQKAETMVATVREQVREGLAELRATVATLREPLETQLALTISIDRLVQSFKTATNLDISLEIDPQLSALPGAYNLAIYRAVQEALTNIQRHAQAARVWLEFIQTGSQLQITISDDGVGFPTEVKTTAFGLRGIRERVTHLNGSLRLDERPGGGARLQITIPIPEAQDD